MMKKQEVNVEKLEKYGYKVIGDTVLKWVSGRVFDGPLTPHQCEQAKKELTYSYQALKGLVKLRALHTITKFLGVE